MVRFNENNEIIREDEYRAILVGLQLSEDISYSMDELEELAEADNVTVLGRMIQVLDRPNTATFIGKGKAQELAEMCEAMEYETEVGPEVHAPKPVYPTGVNGPPLGLNAPLNGSTPGQSVLKKTERFDSDASKKFEADLREYSLAEFHAWWDMKVGFLCPLSAPSACAHRV